MMDQQGYSETKAGDLAGGDIVALDETALVAEAAKVMRRMGVMSILVSSRTGPYVGIVTEKDILYRVVAENKGPFKTALRDIMSEPLITVDADVPAKDAIQLMRAKSIRRLPVTRGGKVIGMLTLRSIVGNSLLQAVDLAEVDALKESHARDVRCPYCGSGFQDKAGLSKHIDRLHLGAGLLEGDFRQW